MTKSSINTLLWTMAIVVLANVVSYYAIDMIKKKSLTA